MRGSVYLVTSCLARARGAMVEDMRTRNSGTMLRGVESSSSVLNTQTCNMTS